MKKAKKRSKKSYKAMLRAVAAVSAIAVVVGGVTFAALESQQVKLTGNTIQSATANLGISSDGFNYGSAANGFTFDRLVPGGQAEPQAGNAFYLRNNGGVALKLKLSINSVPVNPNNIDLSKVNVILTPNNGAAAQNVTLQTLMEADQTGGYALTSPASLAGSGGVVQYRIQISMDPDAFSGNTASLGNIDFAFKGEAITN